MSDLEDDIFLAYDQIADLREWIGDGGTIAHVRDDTVTINLPNGSFIKIRLGPIQNLLDALRKMDR